jgi:hypothetical protein
MVRRAEAGLVVETLEALTQDAQTPLAHVTRSTPSDSGSRH